MTSQGSTFRWDVTRYRHLKRDGVCDDKDVKMIIDTFSRQLNVYVKGRERESVDFSQIINGYPRINYHNTFLFVLFNNENQGFRLSFAQNCKAEIMEVISKISRQESSSQNSQSLRPSSSSSSFSNNGSSSSSIPAFTSPSNQISNSRKAPANSRTQNPVIPSKITDAVETNDQSTQTDTIVEVLRQNPTQIRECLKSLVANEIFVRMMKDARAKFQRMSKREKDDMLQKVNPTVNTQPSLPSSSQPPPAMRHYPTSDLDYDILQL